MRGTPGHAVRPLHAERIIPADAGNTDDIRAGLPHIEDHPRGCGEHSSMFESRYLE